MKSFLPGLGGIVPTFSRKKRKFNIQNLFKTLIHIWINLSWSIKDIK